MERLEDYVKVTSFFSLSWKIFLMAQFENASFVQKLSDIQISDNTELSSVLEVGSLLRSNAPSRSAGCEIPFIFCLFN